MKSLFYEKKHLQDKIKNMLETHANINTAD